MAASTKSVKKATNWKKFRFSELRFIRKNTTRMLSMTAKVSIRTISCGPAMF
jgi:hypothetical protein